MSEDLKKFLPWILLLAMGLGWGLAFSLAKLAIMAGGMPLGMAFWQMVASTVMTFVICKLRGLPIPLSRHHICLLYTSPSPRDATLSRMPSSA